MTHPSKTKPEALEIIRRLGTESVAKINEEILRVCGITVSRMTIQRYRRQFGVKYAADVSGDKNPAWADSPDRMMPDGYLVIRAIVNGKSRWVLKHRHEWVKVHGPIPKGMRLVCLGDKSDCRPENWRMMSHGSASMMAIHSPVKLKDAPSEIKPTLAVLAELKMKLKQKGR